MSTSTELDPHLTKCIGFLYESRKLRKGDPVPLQYILEDAILQKTGVVKDYTDFFQSQLPSRESDEPTVMTTYDDKGNDSDNDLELDLFKDDLSCVVCNKMDIGARNRLVECKDCHALYHQECHKPAVTEEDMMDSWNCSNCKGVSTKKLKTSEKDYGSKSSKSDGHRHVSSSHKSSSDKYKSSSSKSSKSGSSASPSHSSSKSEDKKSSKSSRSSSSTSSFSKYYSEKRKHD